MTRDILPAPTSHTHYQNGSQGHACSEGGDVQQLVGGKMHHALSSRREQSLSDAAILQDKSHTIVLVQRTQSKASRTFLDYNTVSGAVDGKPAACSWYTLS